MRIFQLFLFMVPAFIWGYLLGDWVGFRDGMRLADGWRRLALDYKELYSIEKAEDESEVKAAREVREMERMYDGDFE